MIYDAYNILIHMKKNVEPKYVCTQVKSIHVGIIEHVLVHVPHMYPYVVQQIHIIRT